MARLVDRAGSERQDIATNDVTLRFEGVSRSFGEVKAVAGISFELRRGEILTLLGPSGCGKTTTLRMAIGLERCDAGRILYCGAVVDSPRDRRFVPPEKREMGMVFQSYAIWPHMSVKENVAYPLRYRRLAKPEITRRVDDILEVVGLSGLEERRGTQLSGGQQQRVAVARGIVADPDVLLMDEPFSNLDAKLREQMRAELKRLQRRLGISILFVTHDQTEALAISDRIAVMKDGQIEQIGDPVDLYAAPETAAVRDFLGKSILLPGRIVARNGASTIDASLADGQVVSIGGGDKTRTAQVGDACLVAVRPESIIVEPGGSANGADGDTNAFDATIQTILFMGESYEADVELPGGQMALINLSPTRRWREGQTVRLMLPPEKLQIWDFEAVGDADG